MTAVQQSYQTYAPKGVIGQIVRVNAPWEVEGHLKFNAYSNRKAKVYPGDAVVFDMANNEWIGAQNSGAENQTLGIVTYRDDAIQESASGIPVYQDGDYIPVCIGGNIFVKAGSAIQNRSFIRYTADPNRDWDSYTLPSSSVSVPGNSAAQIKTAIDSAVDGLVTRVPPMIITAASEAAAGELVIARIPFARLF